jgi:protein-S-isoprenylcysteine O-methyltransferase Ste14
MKSLNVRATLAMVGLAAGMALLIFVPAGTVRYWQAWLYLLVFVSASGLITIDLSRRDPALLERRMRGGPTAETRASQQLIMVATSLGFGALLVVPALDHKQRWSIVPTAVVLAGDALVAIGFYFIYLVYRENTFTSATIQVVSGQKVISTGPYSLIRHPMYASGTLYLLGTPLALGSWWGLVPFALMAPFLVWRLFDEERLLCDTLPGYREYRQKVRHRLIPGIW